MHAHTYSHTVLTSHPPNYSRQPRGSMTSMKGCQCNDGGGECHCADDVEAGVGSTVGGAATSGGDHGFGSGLWKKVGRRLQSFYANFEFEPFNLKIACFRMFWHVSSNARVVLRCVLLLFISAQHVLAPTHTHLYTHTHAHSHTHAHMYNTTNRARK
jgi:hypothetical protein